MAASCVDDKVTEILIHRDDEAFFRSSQCQDVCIEHPDIQLANGQHIMTLIGQPLFNNAAAPHIDEHFHAATTR